MPTDPQRPSGLDLRFAPGTPAGFTPAGIAAFDDLRPAAVVRELIQNSLDAADEADEARAIVRFKVGTCDIDDVPGIEAYCNAFHAALEFHEAGGELPSKARQVASTIEHALHQKSFRVLHVLDNGVGLDERRMTALLSDGVSAKPQGSAGTYGNGHSVAIPASDLRYALYGGVTREGQRLAAGHAVLASHVGDHHDFLCSGDGFLVNGFGNGTDGNVFDYGDKGAIPKLIARELDDIAWTSGHGTAVILPAFNRFRERKRSVSDMVMEAAACNFFVAIHEGRLEIRVEDETDGDAKPLTLESSNLLQTLAGHRDKKRAGAFLSGARAFDAFAALKYGTAATIETSAGQIGIHLLQDVETTRIDLCRKGMWVTDDKGIPGFYYKFTDRVPFHAVLILDAEPGAKLHDLVRDSEGPLHDKIRAKDLSKVKQRQLRKALGEVRDWILEHTTLVEGDAYGVDDFLAIDFGDEGGSAAGTAATSYRGTPAIVTRRVQTWHSSRSGKVRAKPGDKPGSGGGDKTRQRRGAVLKPAFQAISVPVKPGRRRFHVVCGERCENAVFRLRVNENVDATCEALWYEIVPAVLEDVRVDGVAVSEDKLVRRDTGEAAVVGVRLGNLEPGDSIQVETRYLVPPEFGSWRGADPALTVEVVQGGSGQPPQVQPDSASPGASPAVAAEDSE